MIDHEYIKELVLLGTDRKTLDPKRIPHPIIERLPQGENEAANLLNLMSYLSFYTKHGTDLQIIIHPLNKDIIQEEFSYSSEAANQIFNEINELTYHSKSDLLILWIQQVLDANKIASPSVVIDLIKSATTFNKEVKKQIRAIVGNRGRKLLDEFYQAAYAEANIDQESPWDTKSSLERKIQFTKSRSIDAQSTIDLIEKSWQDENVKDKLYYLKEISRGMQKSDFEFLVRIYKNEFQGQRITKKLSRECKLLIAGMLVRRDYSTLTEEIKDFFRPYVKSVKSKGLIGKVMGKKTWELILPKVPNHDWNGENLNRMFGHEEKNMNIQVFDFDPYYWLNTFITYLPFSFWSLILDKELKEVLKYFLFNQNYRTTINQKNISIFEKALIENASITQNIELTNALVDLSHSDDLKVLAPLMSEQSFEKYVLKNRAIIKTDILMARGETFDTIWSVQFSKKAISELLNICKNGRFQPHQKFGSVISKYYNSAALPHLSKITDSVENEYWSNTWEKNIYQPIKKSVELREKLKNITI